MTNIDRFGIDLDRWPGLEGATIDFDMWEALRTVEDDLGDLIKELGTMGALCAEAGLDDDHKAAVASVTHLSEGVGAFLDEARVRGEA